MDFELTEEQIIQLIPPLNLIEEFMNNPENMKKFAEWKEKRKEADDD